MSRGSGRRTAVERERKRRQQAAPQRAGEPGDVDADLWAALRQGARNVAGVRWQVAVTCHLLVTAWAGQLRWQRFTPEGFEDLDCVDSNGNHLLLQMKELGAGSGRITAAGVAEALAHCATSSRGTVHAVVTDGTFGSGLVPTGWDRRLDEACDTETTRRLADVVASRGVDAERARDIVAACRLVHLPWNLAPATVDVITSRAVHPAVASLVVAALYDQLSQSSADQRSATADTAISHRPGDVDAVIAEIQSVVDLAGLDEAIHSGVCAPADYRRRSPHTRKQFYAGVDAVPQHVASDLDVVRPREMDEIALAAVEQRYVAIVGPSGSGKSTLLWRAARDAIGGSRTVRVLRIANDADVELLVRHVKLLQPSERSAVVVAADDLGRPTTAEWRSVARRLVEVPFVVLLGACREEDAGPAVFDGAVRIVRPYLDEATANDLADRVTAAGIRPVLRTDEAWGRSEGLLMEFLALLTEGRRLRDVVTTQADELRAPSRALQRAVTRIVATAHSVGLSVPADTLAAVVASSGTPDEVGDALDTLRGEHVLVEHDGAWRGLHELRSATLASALHRSPPPTATDTWTQVAAAVPVDDTGWLLRRLAHQHADVVPGVAAALSTRLAVSPISARELAQVFEGAERADNAVYAADCLHVLRSIVGDVTGEAAFQFVTQAYAARHRNAPPDPGRWSATRQHSRAISDIAGRLPQQSIATQTALASGFTAEHIVSAAVRAPLADAVRLLEAVGRSIALTSESVEAIRRQFTDNPFDQLARFVAPIAGEVAPLPPAARQLMDYVGLAAMSDEEADLHCRLFAQLGTHVEPAEIDLALGPFQYRVDFAVQTSPGVVGVEVGSDRSAGKVTVHYMPDPYSAPSNTAREWDQQELPGQFAAKDSGMVLASRVLSMCVEINEVDVEWVSPSGRPLVVMTVPVRRQHFTREHSDEREVARREVGFHAAVRARLASATWTELVESQAAMAERLVGLVREAPLRIRAVDSSFHRRRWLASVSSVIADSASMLSSPTLWTSPQLPASQAKEDDDTRRYDPVTAGLLQTAKALSGALAADRIAVVMQLRDAADALDAAQAHADITIARHGRVTRRIPSDLIDGIRRFADICVLSRSEPHLIEQIHVDDPAGTAARTLDEQRGTALQEETPIVTELSRIEGTLVSVVTDEHPPPTSLMNQAWVVRTESWRWGEVLAAVQDWKERGIFITSRVVLAPPGPLKSASNTARV